MPNTDVPDRVAAAAEELLSPTECARRAGYTREQIVRRIEKGLIESRIVAGRCLVPQGALERFLRQCGDAGAR